MYNTKELLLLCHTNAGKLISHLAAPSQAASDRREIGRNLPLVGVLERSGHKELWSMAWKNKRSAKLSLNSEK